MPALCYGRGMTDLEKAIAAFGAVFFGGLLRLLISRWCEKRASKTGTAKGRNLPPGVGYYGRAIAQQSSLQKPLHRIEIERRCADASRHGARP